MELFELSRYDATSLFWISQFRRQFWCPSHLSPPSVLPGSWGCRRSSAPDSRAAAIIDWLINWTIDSIDWSIDWIKSYLLSHRVRVLGRVDGRLEFKNVWFNHINRSIESIDQSNQKSIESPSRSRRCSCATATAARRWSGGASGARACTGRWAPGRASRRSGTRWWRTASEWSINQSNQSIDQINRSDQIIDQIDRTMIRAVCVRCARRRRRHDMMPADCAWYSKSSSFGWM